MRLLVCGDRDWANQPAIYRELCRFPPGTVVIHGGCRGADRIADHVARMLGFEVEEYRVTEEDWRTQGKRAGPRRNYRMIAEGKPDLVLAFHPDLGLSRGTADMVRRARAAGIPVQVFEK